LAYQGPLNNKNKVRIDIPDLYQSVSEEVWIDLEQYLFTGFLTSPASILDKSFVFKSLNHIEIDYISYLRPSRKNAIELQTIFNASFIAHSVFIVDGENTLHNRPDHIGKLIKIFKHLSQDVQSKIINTLRILNEKTARLYPLTEVYVHENRSRYKWLQFKNTPIHSPLATGVAGTNELGMNYVQQTWTVLNRLLDERDIIDREWTNAKFVGSCFAGKGMKSIDDRDQARRETERTEREDRKMEVLYNYLNFNKSKYSKKPIQITLPDGRQADVVEKFKMGSISELSDQLSSALSGEKDHHDIVVENKMSQINKVQKIIESERYNIYRGSVLNDDSFKTTSIPLHGSSRILGGKKEAEDQIKRMQDMQFKFLKNKHEKIPPDLENLNEENKIESDMENEDGG